MFSESLSVRILADSSSLRTELDAAVRRLADFQNRIAGIADVGRTLASSFGGLAQAVAPLQTLTKLLVGIQQHIRAIAATPLAINTAPAMAALAALSEAISAVAGQLLALSALSTAPAVTGTGSNLGIANSPVPASAIGAAPVALPAKLSLAVAPTLQIPIPQLTLPALNVNTLQGDMTTAGPRRPKSPADAPVPGPASARQPAAPAPSTTSNHFGGITIHVRETADVNALIRDLRLQGAHLRNRRG